jgi:hypothetical protein
VDPSLRDDDGAGYADLLVGAPFSDHSGLFAGAARLVLGSGSPAGASLAAADTRYTGEAEGDMAGDGVAGGGGDVDADGFDDFLIGASGYDDAAGAVYLVLGSGM